MLNSSGNVFVIILKLNILESELEISIHKKTHVYQNLGGPGLEIRGCQEPRAPLNSPTAPSNICREPKNLLVSIHNTFR